MKAQSAKSLFRATKPKVKKDDRQTSMDADMPEQRKPSEARDPLDFDPTPPSATRAFLSAERVFLRNHSNVIWEPAAGAVHISKVLTQDGFEVVSTDIVDRGFDLDLLRSFYDFYPTASLPVPASCVVTNPPYNQISARDGRGRWLQHSIDLGLNYFAFLLNAEWPAARINGMDWLLENHPPSIEYLCTWKIDFRGGGAPPQRNSWFVWDKLRAPLPGGGWIRKRLYRDLDDRQEALL